MKMTLKMMVSACLLMVMLLSMAAPVFATEAAPEATVMPEGDVTVQPDADSTADPVVFTGNAYVYLDADGDIYYGDTITLRAEVENANLPYHIRWEYNDGDGWEIIPEETGKKYEFVVTETNAEYEYRVVLTLAE